MITGVFTVLMVVAFLLLLLFLLNHLKDDF